MGKRKGRGKGAAKKLTPRRAPSNRFSSQVLPWAQAATVPKFSLADEAHWVSNHRSSAFDTSKKLRHLKIDFVSAGCLEGTIKEPNPSAKPTLPISSDSSSSPAASSRVNLDAMAHMTIRSTSPTSEDEVLFTGRGRMQAPFSGQTRVTEAIASSSRQQVLHDNVSVEPSEHTVILRPSREAVTAISELETDVLRENVCFDTPQLTATSSSEHEQASITADFSVQASTEISIRVKAQETPNIPQGESDSDGDSVIDTEFEKRRGGKQKWEGQTVRWVSRSKPGIGWLPVRDRPDMEAFLRGEANPEDTAMEDYMRNVEEFGLKDELVSASGFASREMGSDAGSHNDRKSDSIDFQEHDDGWNSDTLRDLEGLSTSSDVMDTVVNILSRRTRKTSIQYLCVYAGSTVDDARWLPATFLKSAAEKKLISDFEAEMLSHDQPIGSSSGSDSEIDKDVGTDEYDDEEEEELDDEAIARVLQKQEELGLGSDEVMLYGGDAYFHGWFDASVPSRGFSRPNKKRQQRYGSGNHSQPTFPSASAMVDALAMDPYGGFDIMDTERPSLRPRKKGRRGQMPPELEDEDLNSQMQATWEADRNKKRLKKAEREELRKQGVLGRKGKGPDLSVKYKDGIDMQDVVEEIREFLMSEVQTLSLPPMEARRRATIHQFVNFLNVNSRSRGDGADRFTILSKTSRTKKLSDDEFDAAIARKGFKQRLRGSTRGGSTQGGPSARPTVSYKDGETVGAHAPELGPENRGRAMLEKMGWSKGMALGAFNNKGILHPIPHTVKTTKAGLQ